MLRRRHKKGGNSSIVDILSLLSIKTLLSMWQCLTTRKLILHGPIQFSIHENIVAAFQWMHVLPTKHNYAWLTRKCDYRTDIHTDGRTDRWTDAGQSDPYVPLCNKICVKLKVHIQETNAQFLYHNLLGVSWGKDLTKIAYMLIN